MKFVSIKKAPCRLRPLFEDAVRDNTVDFWVGYLEQFGRTPHWWSLTAEWRRLVAEAPTLTEAMAIRIRTAGHCFCRLPPGSWHGGKATMHQTFVSYNLLDDCSIPVDALLN